jgi:hypothetical protein
MATMVIRHSITDYDRWRQVYDQSDPLRIQHGFTGGRIFRDAGDASTLLIVQEFESLGQAQSFASDPGLKAAMERAGVAGPPRIEFYDEVS